MSNSNTNLQTQSSNALHNAIMEAGSKDRPPMLAPGNYVQWKSRIKRYIDTKPNSELIHYCLQNPPYTYQWAEKTVPVAEGSSETTTERYMENYKNVSQDIRDQLNAEAEAVQIILTGIDNDIYSTVDACPNACEMWKAIERLKQGESINVQDLETNLYWEFGKFTSRDVNVQFLLQLQPEWQRFVTLVKQSQELKTVSYHKLYDILKQHQNEVNEIRAERLARTANPLALVAQQQPVYHHQNHPTQNTQYSSTRSQQSTITRGKAIVTSSAPTYDPEPATVTEDEEMSKEKEIDKLMALISLSFKKIYKPTNNNLRTSSNTSRANQDNSPRINRGTGYDNQRAVNVAGARENVGTPVVQKSGIQCYNCKEYGHVSRECQKPKRVKDAAYHKEKMLLCKQEEAGVQLNAEQADWKDDTDDESEEQELEAHYMYMAQIYTTMFYTKKLERVIPNTSVSRPQLKSNHLEDRVMSNNSQGKKQEFFVKDHINTVKQGGSSVADYYHRLNSLWIEFDALTKLPKCTCDVKCSCDASKELRLHQQLMKLMQFLMGLDDCWRNPIEESHRGIPESSGGAESKHNDATFVAKTFNNNKKQYNNNGNNFTRGSSSNVNRGPNPNLNCKHCGKIGLDRCFEIVGFPQGFKRNFNSNSNTLLMLILRLK
ncbi:uncharacterized mitochondrial protein-like protein [Tanacetum coccineum]